MIAKVMPISKQKDNKTRTLKKTKQQQIKIEKRKQTDKKIIRTQNA